MSAAKRLKTDHSDKSNYDWNVEAKVVNLFNTRWDSDGNITWSESEGKIPLNNEALPSAVVEQYNLNHGDLLQ